MRALGLMAHHCDGQLTVMGDNLGCCGESNKLSDVMMGILGGKNDVPRTESPETPESAPRLGSSFLDFFPFFLLHFSHLPVHVPLPLSVPAPLPTPVPASSRMLCARSRTPRRTVMKRRAHLAPLSNPSALVAPSALAAAAGCASTCAWPAVVRVVCGSRAASSSTSTAWITTRELFSQ